MAFEFKLPDIGEGVVEGEIVKWLVKAGEPVEVDQPMVEVMTDKATVVIPSPTKGVVQETRGGEGDMVEVHSVIVVIDESAAPGASAVAATSAPAGTPTSGPAASSEPAATPASSPGPTTTPTSGPVTSSGPVASAVLASAPPPAPIPASPAPAGGKVLAAPATRRLAREIGVDISIVAGTGPAGRVTSDDVRRAVQVTAPALAQTTPIAPVAPAPSGPAARAPRPAPTPAAPSGQDQRIPVRGLRRRIWDNMAQSAFTAAHFTFVEECDCTELVKMRARYNTRLLEGEPKLNYLPFISKAVLVSLKRFPQLNGHVDDDSMEHIQRADRHLGIAVASERGLVVPVVRHADRLSLVALEQEIRRLADAVRTASLQQEDLGGSTFTITSLGREGGIFATPIINYPEVAIMGVHKMVKRPMVVGEEIKIRDMMNLSLSFDHRLIDGHVGAAFTYSVIKLLESPDRLMMEI